jgi:hypothetical protein
MQPLTRLTNSINSVPGVVTLFGSLRISENKTGLPPVGAADKP